MSSGLLPRKLVEARAPERTAARPLSRVGELMVLSLLAAAAVYAVLLPLAPDGGMVAPDLVFCLVMAWVLRTPKPLPILLLAAIGLFADLALSRPPGLGALGLVLAAEFIRGRAGRLVGAPFPVEWFAVVATFGLMLVGEQALLHLVFSPPPGGSDLLRHFAATAIAYPVLVAAIVWGLGLRAGGRNAG